MAAMIIEKKMKQLKDQFETEGYVVLDKAFRKEDLTTSLLTRMCPCAIHLWICAREESARTAVRYRSSRAGAASAGTV